MSEVHPQHQHSALSDGGSTSSPAAPTAQTSPSSAVMTRRRVVAGAAWSGPVITVLAAAPSAAASHGSKPVDGCIDLEGCQPPSVDCNIRNAPTCVTIRAQRGAIPVGTAVTLSFDPALIAARFTDGSVTATETDGIVTGLLTVAVAAGATLVLPIDVTRAAPLGGAQRAHAGWKDTRGWSSHCSSAKLDATLQVLPGEIRSSNNSARRSITVR
ncbi:hypothetical protein HQQ80_07605 [Microbacteriaceae bacterium VKM Ac-2855]|nr:hypothetical protein [Microbacteriaceae bacterium VKM Ac-2855]